MSNVAGTRALKFPLASPILSRYTVPSERKEEMIQRELELIDEIISTDEELSPNKPPKCTLPLLSLPLSSSL
jgi:hypothetical protein